MSDYDIAKLAPVYSKQSWCLHYEGVFQEHCEKYANGLYDIAFHKAGKQLHEVYFDSLCQYNPSNRPSGVVHDLMLTRYGDFKNFTKAMLQAAEKLHGNGWVWLNMSGYWNIIPNHRIVDDPALVIDLWEHAYLLNYGHCREQYLVEHLCIIDWQVVGDRILKYRAKKKNARRD